mgnify:FL=1|jgi:hypothetical protein
MGEYCQVQKMKSFDDLNDYFRATYGFSLFLREEPALMSRTKKPAQWVGADAPDAVLLRRTGHPPTKYPKCRGIISNGGHRPISMSTLLSNIKEGKELFRQLQ